MEDFVQSANINAKWLENVYENIKNLEKIERLAREGCSSLMEYLNIPANKREIMIGEAQYKNLRFFTSEFILLLSDLTPIITDEKVNNIKYILKNISSSLKNNRNLFIKDIYNSQRQLTQVKLTPFFDETLETLSTLKVELFMEIKKILYI